MLSLINLLVAWLQMHFFWVLFRTLSIFCSSCPAPEGYWELVNRIEPVWHERWAKRYRPKVATIFELVPLFCHEHLCANLNWFFSRWDHRRWFCWRPRRWLRLGADLIVPELWGLVNLNLQVGGPQASPWCLQDVQNAQVFRELLTSPIKKIFQKLRNKIVHQFTMV